MAIKKKMMLAALFLSATFLPTAAKSLVLTLADGSEVYYLLGGDTNPMMKFIDGEVYINTDEYSFSQIEKFRISQTDDPNGIETVVSEKNGINIEQGAVYIKTAAKAGEISVYAANGAKIDAPVEKSGDIVTVHTATVPQGVYIIKTGNSSVKFIKH
ncbi:MAG: T9SS type A sorting domain-containing protein [Bacteroides sp.]|nr:T9SS type A sorting domain-containing protein [Roseburia sp.]MCM1347645.1 T9SS type A sorting domain-containing protein [Bacteroides sp.]MCM1422067.1 T9SS type A sorting domain-containing protein [Bacteroides sp.]